MGLYEFSTFLQKVFHNQLWKTPESRMKLTKNDCGKLFVTFFQILQGLRDVFNGTGKKFSTFSTTKNSFQKFSTSFPQVFHNQKNH